MDIEKTPRGFIRLIHPSYPEGDRIPIVGESSMIGDYPDSFDIPGSSYLHISNTHHLNREEVRELIMNMQFWLDNKRLSTAVKI